MNIYSADQNAIINQANLALAAGEGGNPFEPNPDPDGGNVNLFQNDLLTLWILYGDQYLSSARLGNFGRATNGNIKEEYLRQIFHDDKKKLQKKTNPKDELMKKYMQRMGKNLPVSKKVEEANENIYPALLFYKKTLNELYPILDIGIQPSKNIPGDSEAIIAFKKRVDGPEVLVDYAKIALDEQGILAIDNRGSVTNLSTDNGNNKVIKTTMLSTTNTNGLINTARTNIQAPVPEENGNETLADIKTVDNTSIIDGGVTVEVGKETLFGENGSLATYACLCNGDDVSVTWNVPLLAQNTNLIYQTTTSKSSGTTTTTSTNNIFITTKSTFNGKNHNAVDTYALGIRETMLSTDNTLANTTLTLAGPVTSGDSGTMNVNLPVSDSNAAVNYLVTDGQGFVTNLPIAVVQKPVNEKLEALAKENIQLRDELNELKLQFATLKLHIMKQ